ncbi:hypothetical protein KI614_13285 [Dechloromonas denitrificans]|uniref:hypothetical protein n=1 Tax=Dechloromonas denitrificans TaxID=281362 RepID=UPI001CF8FF18|nr:hypothetical protein [Dechloromonas denitrificans]UCV11118.1 hypothetical protein KI614_13285 [Dechloromonas denitrificans]
MKSSNLKFSLLPAIASPAMSLKAMAAVYAKAVQAVVAVALRVSSKRKTIVRAQITTITTVDRVKTNHHLAAGLRPDFIASLP